MPQETTLFYPNGEKCGAAKTDEALARVGDVIPARGETALALFDWTQRAADIWRGSNNAVRRKILDVVCLNRTLDDVNLVATKRKPFDVFAEGLDLENSRGDRIRTCDLLNPILSQTPLPLFVLYRSSLTGKALSDILVVSCYAVIGLILAHNIART